MIEIKISKMERKKINKIEEEIKLHPKKNTSGSSFNCQNIKK